MNPNDSAQDAFDRGNAAALKGSFQRAVDHYDDAIDSDPQHWRAYYNRALAFCRLEKYGLAFSDLCKCLEINPDHTDAQKLRDLALAGLAAKVGGRQ